MIEILTRSYKAQLIKTNNTFVQRTQNMTYLYIMICIGDRIVQA